ncbi:MAG: hypothetical protein NVS3B20_06800 [Polyangiales bacterium]
MLDLFRKSGAMSFVYPVLMGAMALIFIIQFRPNAGGPTSSLFPKCVAKVRGACIDEKDYYSQRFLLHTGAETAAAINYNKAALDSLIERTLLTQEADRIGLRVTDDDVMHEVIRGRVYVTVPASMRAQSQKNFGVDFFGGYRLTQFGTKEKPFDQQRFESVINATTRQKPSEFADSQLEELRAYRMVALVAERVRVSDAEAWDQYQLEKTNTTASNVRFSPEFFADHFVSTDERLVDQWATDHKADVDALETAWPKEQEKRLLKPRHIFLESKMDASAEEKAATKKKADDIVARINGGEDFGNLAKELSADSSNKDKGGEFDWTPGFDLPFHDALARLKVGETTVVDTPLGVHVLQITKRFDGRNALAFPKYRESRATDLAKDVAEKVAAALKAKLPLVLDAAQKAQIEDAQKGGKAEAEATSQVVEDETKTLVGHAIDDALLSLLPSNAPSNASSTLAEKTDDKKKMSTVAALAWKLDDRRPRLADSQPFSSGSSPIEGLAEAQPLIDAGAKLGKDTPLIGPVNAGGEQVILLFKNHHDATRVEFEKDRPQYFRAMLAAKRIDAMVNYITGLRESLTKDTLTIEARYELPDKDKKGGGGAETPAPPSEPFDEPQ